MEEIVSFLFLMFAIAAGIWAYNKWFKNCGCSS